jgi:hypothetical protein
VKTCLLGAGAELLHLTTSFRAPPSIQHFVNGAFAPAIAADAEASGYVALERCRSGLRTARQSSRCPFQDPMATLVRSLTIASTSHCRVRSALSSTG